MIRSGLLTLAALAVAQASPLHKRADAGYLATTFVYDQGRDQEQVYFHIASAAEPQNFRTLNGGAPYLEATAGTKGVRDPAPIKLIDDSKIFILATDLNTVTTDWGTAGRFGSRSLHIWESEDAVNWSEDRLAEVMPETAGFVWAPSSIWDPAAEQYAVFWSSNLYEESDTNHEGQATGPYIFYSHTSDFVSFTSPNRWLPNDNNTYIDQEVQHIGGDSFIRYLGDSSEAKRIIVDRSDNGIFGDWTRIGVPVDANREGAVSYKDINDPGLYYLWEDNFPDNRYDCYTTRDFSVPYEPCTTNISPAMRHGGVVTVDAARFAALSER